MELDGIISIVIVSVTYLLLVERRLSRVETKTKEIERRIYELADIFKSKRKTNDFSPEFGRTDCDSEEERD